MNPELKEALARYRLYTLNIISSLENEEYDNLRILFDQRQIEINRMNSMRYLQDEFKRVCDELDILKLQYKLAVLMNEKKQKLKGEISRFQGAKKASKGYHKSFNVDPLFFSKKI